ncbi:hypothetical protein BU16DRAFT_609934 [Lophium mytilinum]|uniref:Uncharacterized protein n=1 Tax=Lophium mytilinum TaxID=390894 RepID=A0A6A6QSU7_9PEZI|nr:hypothetical protein BU16DRAFT_609934 [Lophium mytilinum]
MDPSSPPKDGTCHFFRPAQEIRDMIYEYALTSPDGRIICNEYIAFDDDAHQPFTRLEFPRSNCTEVNQLRHVCKRLCEETTGLTLKFNKHVEFFDKTFLVSEYQEPESYFSDCSNSAVDKCITFLSACTPKSRAKLHSIVIEIPHADDAPYAEIATTLNDLCFMVLHLSIKVIIGDWYFDQASEVHDFLRIGYLLESKRQAYELGSAPNLKLVPCEEVFDEAMFTQGLARRWRPFNVKQSFPRDTIRWLAEGIVVREESLVDPFFIRIELPILQRR